MQSIRAIRCKLSVKPIDIPILDELFLRYSKACSKISQWGRDNRETNAFGLHRALYHEIKREFSFPANLVCTALRRSSGALKTARMKGRFEFRPTFVALDSHTFSLVLENGEISFSTHEGRKRAALDIGIYQHEALWGADFVKSATLIKAKDGYYCNIIVENGVPDAAPGGVLGVDLGIRNLAALSTGKKFDGTSTKTYREKRWKVRASLQSKGTKGAKRALKRLGGLDSRRMTSKNHWLAKQIVSEAVRAGCNRIIMENLKGIRDKTRVPNRHMNRAVALWAFSQLQEFVRYKSAMNGIRLILVGSAYTSQTCHQCLCLGLRDKETFSCKACGIIMDADLNAAKVIAVRGAGAGVEPADHNAARIADQIVEFFSHSCLAKSVGA